MKYKKEGAQHKFLLFLGFLVFFPLLIPAKAILYNLMDDGDGKMSPLKKIKIKKIDEDLAFNPTYELIPGTRRRPDNVGSSIIINISSAIHLDKSQKTILNITAEVKSLDGTWSEEIKNGDYIRLTFEKNLTKENDIRIFPITVSGNPSVEVYEKNSSKLVANFTSISDGQYNKVLLTNLSSQKQDIFDLHIVGGSVQFDHIVDPLVSPFLLQATIVNYNFTTNLSDRNAWSAYPGASQVFNGTGGGSANYTAANYTAIGARGGNVARRGPLGASDYPFHRFNFTAKELGGQNRSYIQWLTVNVTGMTNASEGAEPSVWNFTSGARGKFSSNLTFSNSTVGNVSMNYTGNVNATNFIQSSSNNISVFVEGMSFDVAGRDNISIDFVQVDIMYLKDVVAPNSSDNMTNSTTAGSTVLHSVLWSDETPMNYSTFSLDNGNGSFLNYSLTTIDSTNWSNFSYVINSTVGSTIRWMIYANDSWITGNNKNVSTTFQYTTTAGPSDSCTCTDGTDWTIINGDQCTLATTCNLGTGRLRIMNGALRIASTGRLNSAGCFIGNDQSFYLENGGRAICR